MKDGLGQALLQIVKAVIAKIALKLGVIIAAIASVVAVIFLIVGLLFYVLLKVLEGLAFIDGNTLLAILGDAFDEFIDQQPPLVRAGLTIIRSLLSLNFSFNLGLQVFSTIVVPFVRDAAYAGLLLVLAWLYGVPEYCLPVITGSDPGLYSVAQRDEEQRVVRIDRERLQQLINLYCAPTYTEEDILKMWEWGDLVIPEDLLEWLSQWAPLENPDPRTLKEYVHRTYWGTDRSLFLDQPLPDQRIMGWPVPPRFRKITALINSYRGHSGVDISIPVNQPIFSVMSGRVVHVSHHPRGYGNFVVISNGNYNITLAHLSAVNVRVGDMVTHGDVIGLSGNTGMSTGPHLHMEIRRREPDGKIVTVDPLRFLAPGIKKNP